MPKFAFRLEDQDSKHYREGTCVFDSKAEAKAELERREVERCVPYMAEAYDELAQAEKERGWENLSSRERAALSLHRQKQPYKLVKLNEVK
jgi:hypothetical protein